MAELDVITPEEAVAAIAAPGATTVKLAAVVTAASQRLDEAVGPIVIREIVDEEHSGIYGACDLELRRWPVVEVSSLIEYDDSGDPTTLTAGSPTVRPADGYRLRATRSEPELGLFGPLVERRAGSAAGWFSDLAVVTYTAGRFETTEDVAERYKEAARIVVVNLWQRVLSGTITFDDAEVPRYPFPRFAIPRAAYELLSDVWQQRPDGRPVAGIA